MNEAQKIGVTATLAADGNGFHLSRLIPMHTQFVSAPSDVSQVVVEAVGALLSAAPAPGMDVLEAHVNDYAQAFQHMGWDWRVKLDAAMDKIRAWVAAQGAGGMPQGLVWTKEKPVVEGAYWHRHLGETDVSSVQIIDGIPMAGEMGWMNTFVDGCEFAGPIPEPVEAIKEGGGT